MDSVKVKLADTYRKMEFLEQAFIQYYDLFCSYRKIGLNDKALEILGMMAELDPQRFTLDGSHNVGLKGSEKILTGPGRNDKNAKFYRDRPGQKETSSFFDMAEMLEGNGPVELEESKSITLEEGYKSEGVIEEIEKTANTEKLYPNYHYQMGLVCKEMGLIDEAIKHFQLALKMPQKPIEANKY
jgi:tetratricopeptide (TPR) repeat protein